MNKKAIEELFCEFWELEKAEQSLVFDKIPDFSSVRFYQFIAAVESNFKVKLKEAHTVITLKDFLDSLEEA